MQTKTTQAAQRTSQNASQSAPQRPEADWIRARQILLKQVRSEVLRRLGAESSDLKRYRQEYEKGLKRRWQIANKAELMAEVEAADIVYGGDFHALGQAQRTHLRVLRAISDDRPVVLALECFSINSQKHLDSYLAGKLSLEGLRKSSKWDRNWGFPWDNYKPLLELAKRRGFYVLALNRNETRGPQSGDLVARDREAARRINQFRLKRPSALIYVIFGDLHLAPNHLPQEVRKLAKRVELRELIIHLNSDLIYFQLARRGLELSVDVVRFNRREYCVLSSPPWVPWQSYLLFLDQTADAEFSQDAEDDYDPTDQVAALIRLVASDLGVEARLDELSVYGSEDNRVWNYLERSLKLKERQMARQLLASGHSFFLPNVGAGFLSRSSINHAASLAGQYLHARISGRRRMLWNMPGDFQALIWVEAVAFFISKLINHKRQSETLTDLRAGIASLSSGDERREAMRVALDHSLSELIWLKQGRRRKALVRPRRKTSYFDAARILGGMMGERLYLAYRSRKLNMKDLLSLLKIDASSRSFRKDYEGILRKISDALEDSGKDASVRSLTITIKTRKERL